MRTRIQPYRSGSTSARALSEATGIRRLRVPTTFRFRSSDRVINWGSTKVLPGAIYAINHPANVAKAVDKIDAFSHFERYEVPTVPWTVYKGEAEEWQTEGKSVLVRTSCTSSGGRGIIVASPEDTLEDAPLYTMYMPKRREYRVHVLGGEVIFVQEKRRRRDVDGISSKIRNANGGYVFCVQDVDPSDKVLGAAIAACDCLRLDYGAVDIGWNDYYARAYVYEVNTAPGLEGTCLEVVSNAIAEYPR